MKGGEFLFASQAPECVFTPEDFTDEHRAIARTADEFWRKEVEPNLEDIWQHKPGAALAVLRKSAELGLTAIVIPEKFGGMEMDLASMMVVAPSASISLARPIPVILPFSATIVSASRIGFSMAPLSSRPILRITSLVGPAA